MSHPKAAEQREYCILEAVERHPLALADLDEKLVDSGLPYDPANLHREVIQIAAEGYVRCSAFPAPRGGSLAGVEIPEDGRGRLTRLRALYPKPLPQLDPVELADRTETYERAGMPLVEVSEAHAMACLTEAELNAWWDSLTLDGKAEVLMNHYASLAEGNEPKEPA